MDAIIIADSSSESVSATNKLKLTIDGHVASIQTVRNFLQNNGRVVGPVEGDRVSSWQSSLRLNGIYLYSYLTGEGFDVALIDSYYDEREKFIGMLKKSPKAIVLSTTFIMNKKILHEVVRDIRSLAPDIFIIAGGSFVHLSHRILQQLQSDHPIMDIYREEFLFLDGANEPDVDLYIISSRGEDILARALKMIQKKGSCSDLPNTAKYRDGKYEFSNQDDNIIFKGGIPVDWSILPDDVFSSGVVPMQASYGCPYHCSFCNFTKDRKLMGAKPLDSLLNELQAVQQRGARYVWFADDNFRLGRNDLDDVCCALIQNGINLKWKCFIRPSAIRTLDMDLLKKAGCIELMFGIESADPAVLEAMNKKSDAGLYEEVIEKTMRAGINCNCYFIFGFPGETAESVKRTFDFIKRIEHPELDGYIYFTLFPFLIAPLSPISELRNAEKYGLQGYMSKWSHNTMNFREALDYATQAFFQLETSGIIYHADNLDMLLELDPRSRKAFIAARHQITKKFAGGLIKEGDKIEEFRSSLLELTALQTNCSINN